MYGDIQIFELFGVYFCHIYQEPSSFGESPFNTESFIHHTPCRLEYVYELHGKSVSPLSEANLSGHRNALMLLQLRRHPHLRYRR